MGVRADCENPPGKDRIGPQRVVEAITVKIPYWKLPGLCKGHPTPEWAKKMGWKNGVRTMKEPGLCKGHPTPEWAKKMGWKNGVRTMKEPATHTLRSGKMY